jgi:hypothetical protein
MPDDTLNALVTEAMFRALDEKKREELIKEALKTLITPVQRGSYHGPATSPIQDAFHDAINAVARDVVREMCKSDEAQDAIREVVGTAFEKMLIDKERLATEMASAMVAAITKAGNY